jgi:hypothetical protein
VVLYLKKKAPIPRWIVPKWNQFKDMIWDSDDRQAAEEMVRKWAINMLDSIRDEFWSPGSAKPNAPLTKDKLLEFIDLIGGILSAHLHKSSAACKGLLIIAISAEVGNDSLFTTSRGQLGHVLNGDLLAKLKQLNVQDLVGLMNKIDAEYKRFFF